jgi:hypothetical protein
VKRRKSARGASPLHSLFAIKGGGPILDVRDDLANGFQFIAFVSSHDDMLT